MKRLLSVLTLGLAATLPLAATTITPVSYTYTRGPVASWHDYGDNTGRQLTDGLYNALTPGVSLGDPTAYNWVGFEGTSPLVTFDFGSAVTISNVTISMLEWNRAGVSLPSQVIIGSSSFNVIDNPQVDDQDHRVLSYNGSWTGSTLTLELLHTNQWTFIDEVTFTLRETTNTVPDTAGTLGLLSLSAALLFAARRRFAV